MLQLIKQALRRYPILHRLVHLVRLLRNPGYRREYRLLHNQLADWRTKNKRLMELPLGDGSAGGAVFFGWSRFEYVLAESVVRKAFEYANYQVHVLTEPNPHNKAVYKTLGVTGLQSFNRFTPLPRLTEAKQIAESLSDFEALIEFKYEGVTVGKYVSSTLMRRTRMGSIKIDDLGVQDALINGLAASIAAVRGAQRLIETLSPKVVVLVDRGYSPYGEVFDVCVNAGVQVVTWNVAHRDNTVMLKRYNNSNRLAHPSSLSSDSWQQLLEMCWTDDKGHSDSLARLQTELSGAYNNGEWYSEVGTQFGKRDWGRSELIQSFGLDPSKRTAVVYAHIFWDATFFWGKDLFRNYEDWFVQTVKTACTNDKLNWLIKVHPANLVKDLRDGVNTDPSEMIALREKIGELPDHVKVIPADSDITTLSLFGITDYCLTVRGTVGIEAALMGTSVLTAGTGRYDHHGFTYDFDSADEYLKALERLQEIGKPSDKMQERAARFGYGIFLCRPVRLKVFDLRFKQNDTATLQANIRAQSLEELRSAPEIQCIASWLHTELDDLMDCPDPVHPLRN